MTPTGNPSAVQCSGSEIAGIPVTFQAEVHGVNRFCASKSAAGSASSRIAPTGNGGSASVGVSTASYGASRISASAANVRSRPTASPNSGPLTRSPHSPSHRVRGRTPARAERILPSVRKQDGSSRNSFGRGVGFGDHRH